MEIHIPGCSDDYYHWMNGVDKCDLFVAYYRNCLRCHRIWISIMFHTLDNMRVNAYIVFKTLTEANNDPTIGHKSFVMAWIEKLLERTTARDYSRTRSAYEQDVAEVSPNPMKKRMNHKLPMLPVERLEGTEEEHVMTISTKRSDCKYYSYLRPLHKAAENTTRLPVSSGCVQSVMYTSYRTLYCLSFQWYKQ